MNIKPVNGHLIIAPRKQETFLPTERGIFQEIGTIVAIADDVKEKYGVMLTTTFVDAKIKIGDEVYFDSWLSSKYPTGEGDEEFYLVPWKDVRAIKPKVENAI